MRDLDFVAIGDIVVDAFIRLTQADVYTQEGVERLCLINGAKIPYESLTVIPAVGNSPNAAVAAARLGLASGLVSDLGADEYGTECLQALAEEHVDSSLVKKHEGKRTNYHYVLWYRDERTILIKHEEYPYALPELGAVRWIYLSSLGEQSFAYHEAIAAYVETHPGTKLAFQPGTFQIKLGAKKLSALYKASEIFFCNTDEARIILGGSLAAASPTPKMASRLPCRQTGSHAHYLHWDQKSPLSPTDPTARTAMTRIRARPTSCRHTQTLNPLLSALAQETLSHPPSLPRLRWERVLKRRSRGPLLTPCLLCRKSARAGDSLRELNWNNYLPLPHPHLSRKSASTGAREGSASLVRSPPHQGRIRG